MSINNTLHTALRGVLANKLRAALTTLGVVIGVASVVAMLALGNGAQAAVEASFRFLGSDTIQIATQKRLKNEEFVNVGEILSYQDGLELPAAAALITRVDMRVLGSGKLRVGRNTIDMGIDGVTAGALEALRSQAQVQPVNWPAGQSLTANAFLAAGRFFSPSEVVANAPVCVLGYQTALDLFEGDQPLDQTVWVNRQRCLVIGVLAELEMIDPSQRTNSKPNDGFYLPISTAISNLFDKEPEVEITARVADEERIDEAKRQIEHFLRQRHAIAPDANGKYEDDFNLTTRQDILGAQQAAARTFSLLLAAMATISLLVGGIGIMNVMLVSVTERTREIGVRMAVGARGRDIVWQFLLEALLLSAGGGVIGVVAGIFSVPLAAQFNNGIALLAPWSIPLALGVALITGLLFGIYPASRAARLDPIEALRYE